MYVEKDSCNLCHDFFFTFLCQNVHTREVGDNGGDDHDEEDERKERLNGQSVSPCAKYFQSRVDNMCFFSLLLGWRSKQGNICKFVCSY